MPHSALPSTQTVFQDTAIGGLSVKEGLSKLPHPVGHIQLIDAVFHPTECGLGGYAVPQHSHCADFVEDVPAERHYPGTSGVSGHASEYHQHDDVIKPVAYIAFVQPAEIGNGRGKCFQFFQDCAPCVEIIAYFCCVIRRTCLDRTDLAK